MTLLRAENLRALGSFELGFYNLPLNLEDLQEPPTTIFAPIPLLRSTHSATIVILPIL
jgi:hypothetical protein